MKMINKKNITGILIPCLILFGVIIPTMIDLPTEFWNLFYQMLFNTLLGKTVLILGFIAMITTLIALLCWFDKKLSQSRELNDNVSKD